ncbi:RagB/SusD family nutrient uptake outer membrane protein [Algibacter lectus]|uniref:Putative outer membrane starch-binding protein n=1 Tax=Algibacter lectus TaxID=221126 RepID=A0A4R8ME59_9FLAO|nr:RagB/SusD family nutrient uptake outer membrane protein [Algibacter lectus]MWW23183.1 RagB/SusD family nutrient uptake outer membrane protein [Algibacter lectus]TDY64139.1 putative outer membrane starch-binding protein [Algibacter lectus]
MKTKYIYLYVAITIAFFSCESFLEEDPKAVIAPETFFASENDARQAMNGVYGILKNNSIYGQVGLDVFYDNGADIIEPNRAANIFEPIGNYSMNEAIADVSVQKMSVSDTWKDLYRVINNVNIVIDRVTDNEAITPASQLDIIADARFVRALSYWHITNLWGDAPYYTEALEIDEVKVLGRTDEAIIISGVLDDLQFAQANLQDAYTGDNSGRASKWAAAIIEAKILMQQEQWQLGLDKCIEIINQSPHALLSNYADVFDPKNEYNSEIIWSLDFAKDIRGQFEEGTVRDDGSLPAVFGNGNWRPSMFSPRLRDEPANNDDSDALKAALAANNEAFNGTGLQVASKDFAEKFPANDLRRALNIQDTYAGIQLNFPYMSKFWNLDVNDSPRFNHSDNRLVFRLADVHLMAAECENERPGGSPIVAYSYIKDLRERAYTSIVDAEIIKGLSQQAFREAIYDERKWELAGEAHRRYDLIRWGILFDVVENLEYRFWDPSANIKSWHVKLPIPLQELQTNPNLLQSDPTNNGYR